MSRTNYVYIKSENFTIPDPIPDPANFTFLFPTAKKMFDGPAIIKSIVAMCPKLNTVELLDPIENIITFSKGPSGSQVENIKLPALAWESYFNVRCDAEFNNTWSLSIDSGQIVVPFDSSEIDASLVGKTTNLFLYFALDYYANPTV